MNPSYAYTAYTLACMDDEAAAVLRNVAQRSAA